MLNTVYAGSQIGCHLPGTKNQQPADLSSKAGTGELRKEGSHWNVLTPALLGVLVLKPGNKARLGQPWPLPWEG